LKNNPPRWNAPLLRSGLRPREIVDAMVKSVVVYNKDRIEIRWKFTDAVIDGVPVAKEDAEIRFGGVF